MNQNEPLGRIHSLETFGLVDGPGVRFIVFLKDCPLRCLYCHNPDTWAAGAEADTVYDAKTLFAKAYRYKNYWKKKGGITVSGGEPLLQLDFLTQFFSLAKEKGVHTCIDTSGAPFSTAPAFLDKFNALLSVTDLFLLDIKAMDDALHQRLTGKTNENILALARYLSDHGKELWIRHVLVPGLTDSEEELLALKDFAATLSTVSRMEILPYHNLGEMKWQQLALSYPLSGTPTPTKEEIARAEALLGISCASL